MEYAISIYKGGKRVYAKDCNFVSYSEEGLICPICKQEVYLRKGNIREPYFAHFHATSSREVEECELRVSADGNSTETSSLIENRGQRLEIFQQHFLSLIYVENSKIIEDAKFNNWINSRKDESDQIINHIIIKCIDYFLENRQSMEAKYITHKTKIKDKRILLQQEVSLEVMSYLCENVKFNYNLRYLLFYSMYQIYQYEEYKLIRQNLKTQDIEKICQYTVRIIMRNSWILAFKNTKINEVNYKRQHNIIKINKVDIKLDKADINDRPKPTTTNRINTGLLGNWSQPFFLQLEPGQYLSDKLGTEPIQCQVAMEQQLLVLYTLDKNYTRSEAVKAGHRHKSFNANLTQQRTKLLTIGTIELTEIPLFKWSATEPQYEHIVKYLNKSTVLPESIQKQYRGLILTNETLSIGDRILCKKNKIGNKVLVKSYLDAKYCENHNQPKQECIWLDQLRNDITKKMLQANYKEVKQKVENYIVNNSDKQIHIATHKIKKLTQTVRSIIRHHQPSASDSDIGRLAMLITEYLITKLNLNKEQAMDVLMSMKKDVKQYTKLRDLVITEHNTLGHLK
ncbi:competence protein CoiA family protein [Nostoc linckia]|uniref:competence protein CoiA family protein n=1 Tax=Nostoc linckia TaxID=92942 RepID=UPI0015D4D2E1|nr:hypothetical protein [Nostoc linckia]